MVSEAAAREIAKELVRARLGEDRRCVQTHFFDRETLQQFELIAGCTVDALAEKNIRPYWTIGFEAFFPNGSLMDECLVVRVDAEDGSASFSS